MLLNFRGVVIEQLVADGHELVLLVPYMTENSNVAVPYGAKVIEVEMTPTSTSPIHDLKLLRQYIRVYKQERPDYIFHYTIKPNIYGGMAAQWLGIPHTSMVAGLGYSFSSNGVKNKIARMLYRIGLRKADHVLVLNADNQKVLLEKKVAKSSQLLLLEGGEGVDLERFAMTDNHSDYVHFLMVARMLYDKGYSETVEAARIVKAKYPHVDVWMLGSLDEESPMGVPHEVIEKDQKEGVIEYLGFTSEPQKIMGKQGVLLLLSSYHEGLNRSLMEACALGKPIITSDIPGCRETVDAGKNGYLVPKKDSKALAEAMEKYILLSDAEKAAMGRASREYAERRFDIKKVIGVYEEILKNVRASK